MRSAPLLTGFRGRPPADIDALADLVVRLTDAVVGTPTLNVWPRKVIRWFSVALPEYSIGVWLKRSLCLRPGLSVSL